jgi:hypothetical protein
MKKPLPPKDFDFAVFGEHPAALWGALMALESGFKVMVVPLGFDPERSLIPKAVAASAGLPAQKDDPALQVLTSSHRFLVGPDLAALEKEHQFCFSKSIDPNLGPNAEILRGLVYLVRGDETAPTVSESWAVNASRLTQTRFLTPGTQDIHSLLLEKIKKKGGTVFKDGEISQIFIEHKRLVGVQLRGQSSVISIDQGILAAPLVLLQPLLNVDGRNRLLKMSSNPPLGWRFEIEIRASADSIPMGLGSRMVYAQKDSPIVDIRHLGALNQAGVFRLRILMPFHEQSLDRGHQRRMAQRLVRLMSDLIPDFSYNVKQVIPEIRDPEQTELQELPKIYPFQTLEEIPLHLRVHGHPGLGFKTPVQGLSLVNDESDPRLGEWGAYQAIQSVFKAWLKKAEPLEQAKRQPLVDRVSLN